jgi:hypothetical protein
MNIAIRTGAQEAPRESGKDSPSAILNPEFLERDGGGPIGSPRWQYLQPPMPMHWSADVHHIPEVGPGSVSVYDRNAPRSVVGHVADVAASLPPGPYNFLYIVAADISQTFTLQQRGTYRLSFYSSRVAVEVSSNYISVGLFRGNQQVWSNRYWITHTIDRFEYHEDTIDLDAGTYSVRVTEGQMTYLTLLQLAHQPVAATNLAIVKGDRQAAFAGDGAFPEDLQVRASGNGGLASSGAQVTFTINGSPGTTFDNGSTTITRTTDENGLTAPVVLIPGLQPATFQVTASCPGTQPVTFHLAIVPARNTFRFSSDPEHIEIERGSSRQVRVLLQSNGTSWPYIRIQGSLLQDNPPPVFFFDRYNGPTDFPPMLPNAGNDYALTIYASDDSGDHTGQLFVQVAPDPHNQGPRQTFQLLRTDPRG